jgi:hypothetical protein
MACLLKLYKKTSPGIITFTTQEKKIISSNSELYLKLTHIKNKFLFGLHFNWHDYKFEPDNLYNFYLAGDSDLIDKNGNVYPALNIDACNFTPSYYNLSDNEKFWDVLIVGNPVFFKRPEVALNTIRGLYNLSSSTPRKKVLYISPQQEYKSKNKKSVFYDIREYYNHLFSKDEQEDFTLMTTNFNSPFPFNRETLAVFFKNSKVFLHCAENEKRCRIAAYAWCAGLPVIAKESVGSILPSHLQIPPAYYKVENDADYPQLIIEALNTYQQFDPLEYQKNLSERYTCNILKEKFIDLYKALNLPFSGDLLHQNLDMRLGWHHENLGKNINGVSQSLSSFIDSILNLNENDINHLKSLPYPEKYFIPQDKERLTVSKFKSPYLDSKPSIIDKIKYFVVK